MIVNLTEMRFLQQIQKTHKLILISNSLCCLMETPPRLPLQKCVFRVFQEETKTSLKTSCYYIHGTRQEKQMWLMDNFRKIYVSKRK